MLGAMSNPTPPVTCRTIPVLDAHRYARLQERKEKLAAQLETLAAQNALVRNLIESVQQAQADIVTRNGLIGLPVGGFAVEDDPKSGVPAGAVFTTDGNLLPAEAQAAATDNTGAKIERALAAADAVLEAKATRGGSTETPTRRYGRPKRVG